MNFVLLNIQCLISKRTNKLKLKELTDIFYKNDLILLTETWTNEFSDISFPGFHVFYLSRTDRKQNSKRDSGGIAIYVRDKYYSSDMLVKQDSDDILWVKFDGSLFNLSNDLYLCLCYIVPSDSSREAFMEVNVLDRICDHIIQISNDTNDCYHLMICGDFNSRTGIESDYVIFDEALNIPVLPDDYETDDALVRFSQDKCVNTNGRKLLEFCKLNGLRICNGRFGQDKGVGKYTYIGSTGSSVVDYVIASPLLLECLSTFHVDDPNILSDHCALYFSLSCLSHAQPNDTVIQPEVGQSKKYVWRPENAEDYMSNISSREQQFLQLQTKLSEAQSGQDIDENISNFVNVMSEICDPLFAKTVRIGSENNKYTSFKENNQPWFDQECSNKREIFYLELNNFRINKNTQTQTRLVEARKNFKLTIRRKRFNYDKSKTEKLIVSQYSNVKEYWRLLKQTAKIETNSKISSQTFSEYFQAINNPSDRFYQADEDILFFNERYLKGEFQIMFDELNVEISLLEINSAVKQLKNGKSAGPDLFLNEFFKNGTNTLLNYVHKLFNRIFEIGYFPDKWSDGFIIPIFKKGDKDEPANYRGITLLSTLGKLFTRILNNRLNVWAEKYRIYIEAQAGFRKNMGTVDNIFILNSLITHLLNQNKQLYCVFVDFTKAFDFVVRDILWYKLLKFGVRGRMLDI
ncbi:MAG: reverse transcriptase family protein, partial [Candidatus Thiodiazotropha sp.]